MRKSRGQGAWSREHGAWSREHGAGGRKQGAGGREQGALTLPLVGQGLRSTPTWNRGVNYVSRYTCIN